MLQPGGESDLALEPLGAERGGELGVEHLERDRAVVLEVAGRGRRWPCRRGRARARAGSDRRAPLWSWLGEASGFISCALDQLLEPGVAPERRERGVDPSQPGERKYGILSSGSSWSSALSGSPTRM